MNGGGQSRLRPYHRSPLPSPSRGTAPRGRLLPDLGCPAKARAPVPRQTRPPVIALTPRQRVGPGRPPRFDAGSRALGSSSGRLRTRRAASCGSHSPGTASHLPRTPDRGSRPRKAGGACFSAAPSAAAAAGRESSVLPCRGPLRPPPPARTRSRWVPRGRRSYPPGAEGSAPPAGTQAPRR